MAVEKADVLIAGLGPVGAALAVYLARMGISVIAIERDTEVYPMPRAAHLDHETMRLLHLAGGADAVLSASQPLSTYEFRAASGELLMGFRPKPGNASTGFPTSSMFHQPTLEHALRARLASEPLATARTGHALVHYEADGNGVSAEVKGPNGAYTVEARFLVGCDGGNSLVRKLAGIELDDMGFDEPWLVIDTRLTNGAVRLTTVGLQLCDPKRPVTSMPMAPGRHRWEFMMLPGETAEEISRTDRIAELIAPFADPAHVEIERRAVYRFHAVIAREWRKGRVLLAGDAAHQMPPFMGQGLCSGVRDAANLGWKLAAVLKGHADMALLDTYQPERAPHVQAITEMAVFMGKVVCTQNEAEAAARDRDMLAKVEGERVGPMPGLAGLSVGIVPGYASSGAVFPEPRLAGEARLRLDDVAGVAPLLITRAPSSAASAAAVFAARGGYVTDVSRLADGDGDLARAMGEAEAVLVRPDRHIFGCGAPGELLAAWDAYLQTGSTAV
ncbi:MAG TPA: bifunctional 3-(3-hydroxy-phenyl)propionate/3-hydroxycinnamic acid hydroxylase [Parvibaculum sp.]